MTGKIDLDFADVKVPLGLVDCYVEDAIDLRHAGIKALELAGTHVPGLHADGLRTSGNVFLGRGFSATGEVRLIGAGIGGQLNCRGEKFEYPEGIALTVERLTVKGGAIYWTAD